MVARTEMIARNNNKMLTQLTSGVPTSSAGQPPISPNNPPGPLPGRPPIPPSGAGRPPSRPPVMPPSGPPMMPPSGPPMEMPEPKNLNGILKELAKKVIIPDFVGRATSPEAKEIMEKKEEQEEAALQQKASEENIIMAAIQRMAGDQNLAMKSGGLMGMAAGGFVGQVPGEGHGMEDNVYMPIVQRQAGKQVGTLAVSPDEYVVDAHTMSALGNGSADAGAKVMDQVVDGVREKAFGTDKQPNQINGLAALRPMIERA
jgi:hypothetical protein